MVRWWNYLEVYLGGCHTALRRRAGAAGPAGRWSPRETGGRGVSHERFCPQNWATLKVSNLRSWKGVFLSLGRVSSLTPFRKTYGNFWFNKCYSVSLFHLATGSVGRGKDGKRFGLFAGQFGQTEKNREAPFAVEVAAESLCPALRGLSAGSEPRLCGELGPGDPRLTQMFLQHFCDFCKKERRKRSEMSGILATVWKAWVKNEGPIFRYRAT